MRTGTSEHVHRHTQLIWRLALGLLLFPLVAQAEVPALSGRITYASTGLPMSGVMVMAMWVANGPVVQRSQQVGCVVVMTTTTNFLGHYSFPTSAPGSHDDSPLPPSLSLVTYKTGYDFGISRLPDPADNGARKIEVNLALPPATYGDSFVYKPQDQSGCPGTKDGTSKASLPYFKAAYLDALKTMLPANESRLNDELGANVIASYLGLPFPTSFSSVAKFLHATGREPLTREMVQQVMNGQVSHLMAYEDLKVAVRSSDTQALRLALEHGGNPNGDDGYAKSLLWEAATHGNSANFDLLRGKGARFRNGEADTLLPDAVYQGYWQIVEAIAPDFHANPALGKACIVKAAGINNPQMLQTLIKLGADPNAVSDDGKSVAEMVMKRFNPATAEVLIAAGVKLGPLPASYYNVLRNLAEERPEALLDMLKAGAQLTKPPYLVSDFDSIPFGAGRSGNQALVQALLERGENVDAMLAGAASKGRDAILSYLIDHGADLKSIAGERAVHSAANGGHVSSLELLFKVGAMLESSAPSKSTNICSAAYLGDVKLAQWLLERGDNVNIRDQSGRTPLMCAAESGKPEVMKVLLDHKADITLRNTEGLTALMLAADGGYHEWGLPSPPPSSPPAPPPALPPAIPINVPAATYARRDNVPRHEDQFAHSPAMQLQLQPMPVCAGGNCFAAASNAPKPPQEHPEVVKILLEHGADADVIGPNDGYTALMRAISARQPGNAKLLAAKSKLAIRNNAGETAKMLADKSGVPELRAVFKVAAP